MMKNIYLKLIKLHHPENRYYLLSTKSWTNNNEYRKIKVIIDKIFKITGTEVIVDTIFNALKRYLRLIRNTTKFINVFTTTLDNNQDLDTPHKKYWNKIINDYEESNKFGGKLS